MSTENAGGIEVQVGANIQGLIDNLGKAAGATNDAFGHMTHAAEGLKGNLGALSGSIEHLGAGVLVFGALGLAAEGIEKAFEYVKDAVKETLELAESFHKLSYETGISYENLAAYDAGMQMIGGHLGQLEGWVKGQTRALKANADSLVENGIASSKAELMGLSFEEYLKRVDEKAQEMANTNERNALMMMAFSRSGVSAGAEMHRLAEGLEEGRKVAQEMGLELSGNDVEAMEQLQKASGRIDVGLQALKVRVGTELLPVLAEFATLVGDYLPGMIDFMVTSTKGLLLVFNDLRLGGIITMSYLDSVFEQTEISATTAFSVIKAAAVGDFSGAMTIMKAGAVGAEAAWAGVEMKIAAAVMAHAEAEAKILTPRSKGHEGAGPKGEGHVIGKGDTEAARKEAEEQRKYSDKLEKNMADLAKDRVDLEISTDEKIEKIQEGLEKEARAATKQTALAEIDAAKQALEAQKSALAERVARGEISKSEELAILKRFVAQENALELQAINAEQAEYKPRTLAYQKFENDKTKIKTKAVNEEVKLADKAITEEQHKFKDFLTKLTSGFSSSISGLIQGTQTWGQAFNNVLSSALNCAINFFVEWGVQELATIATTSAAHTAAATTAIGENAAEAATGGMKSAASIPYVGWAIAIGAGLAIFAAASSMKSAAGGWDRVPSDQMAMIHKDEMVLPASLAGGIRGLIDGGQGGKGQGGGNPTVINHWHILDSQDVKRVLTKHQDAVFGVLKTGIRNGRIG